MVDEAKKTAFQHRFDALMEHFQVTKRTALARALGLEGGQGSQTLSQTLYNWYERDQRIPGYMRRNLESRGVSIDWINDGVGDLLLPPGSGVAEIVEAIALMDRPDPGTLARVHAFLIGNGNYDLADPGYAEVFADAYEWIKAKQRQKDDSPDNGLDFARWCRQKPGASEESMSAPDAELIRTLERFTEGMREKLGEFHRLSEEESAATVKASANKKTG